MSYFSNFPITSIITNIDDMTIVQARNIMVRAKFSNYIKDNDSLFEDYLISDGERPETLAHKVYGRSDLHWMILLFNEMIDPYYDWPLSQKELDNQINYKYPGVAVYVSDLFVYEGGAKAGLPISITESVVQTTTAATIGNTSVSALSYDPLLGKIVVTGYTTTGIPTSGNNTIILTNKNGTVIKSKIIKIEENKTSLHHFEDKYGNWMDPRGRINEVSGGNSTERIKVYTSPSVSTIAAIGSVSNYDHEAILNEKKRKISLLKSKYVNIASKEFSDLFK